MTIPLELLLKFWLSVVKSSMSPMVYGFLHELFISATSPLLLKFPTAVQLVLCILYFIIVHDYFLYIF
jgi:hypothetical protein